MSKERAKAGDEPLPYLPLPPCARGPLDPPLLGAAPPGIGPKLVIAEGVLKKAAGVADQVFDAFHGPAGSSVHGPVTSAVHRTVTWTERIPGKNQ
ncbi:hypothetical protein [Streptomyces sp. NPDC002889]|uniref:hypothetical protein n=1 Tax=Streptomyces sp. NPDC002889 TaxID=3364669 RepID=UPI00368B4755